MSQFCGGKWQAQIYQDVFYNKEHQQNTGTSCFINDSSFSIVPMQLLNEIELNRFDEGKSKVYNETEISQKNHNIRLKVLFLMQLLNLHIQIHYIILCGLD